MTSLPTLIATLVGEFTRAGRVVWLLGSQANGTAKVGSDWDLLVFADESFLQELSKQEPVEGVDLLVVYNRDFFRSPWNQTAEGIVKSGTLSGWEWRELSETQATYTGTKWPNDWGSTKMAIRLR